MTWREHEKYQKWFGRCDLLALCLGVRMTLNGSADPWPTAETAQAVEYIQARLAEWTPSSPKVEARFDEAVRQMCIATVALWRHYVPPCSGGGCFCGCPHDPTEY
jgi:hypothetical protein